MRESRVYTSPADQTDQFVRVPTTAVSDIHRRPPTIPASYRSAFDNLQQDPWNVSRTTASLLTAPKTQFDTVGRPLADHARLLQTIPDSSTIAWLPTGEYEHHRYTSPIEPGRFNAPRQFNPALTTSQPFQYREANVSSYNPQSRVKESISDATAVKSLPTIARSSAPLAPRHPNVINHPQSLFGDIDCHQRSMNDGVSTHSLASDDAYELIKRNERFLWNTDEIASRRPSTVLDTGNLDDNDKATTILENELDRYISNIRKLHGEHGVPSQDELDYEQNTSGDLLNDTLSEDVLEFPTEDREKKERMPEKIARVLASASDFAFKTADSDEIAFQIGRKDNADSSAETENAIRQRTAPSDTLKLLESRRDEAEGSSAFTTRSEIEEQNRGDVATRSSELRQPREEDADIAKENGNNKLNDLVESGEGGGETSTATRYDAKEEASSDNKLAISDEGNASRKKQPVVVENLGKESIVENLFDTAERLAPWDLANVQKKVRQLHLDNPYTDQEITDGKLGEEITSESRASARFTEQRAEGGGENNYDLSRDTLSPASKAQMKISDEADEVEHHDEEIETRACSEVVESFEVSDGHWERKVDELVDVAPRTDAESSKGDESDERKDKSEMSEARVDDPSESVERGNEYDVEQEYTEHNRTQGYKEQDPNEQYDYGLSYEDAGNEEYGKYADQGYARENQEYVEYVDSQYEQYVEDPNNQQYQHDLSAQYQQDSNQAYDYSYDQQYDANQGYDPNQVYEYAEDVPYDPSETYEQECKGEEKEQQPDDDVVKVEDCEGKLPETTETSSEKQVDIISEHKANEDADRDNLQQASAINGANRSKKNTDVIKSLLDSDTDTTIERNVSNTESDDFDFN